MFAAWSTQLETTAGPLAATAAELAKTAQLCDYRQHTKPVPLPSLASSTMLLLAAGSKSKTAAQSALLLQLMRTSRAIYDMHQESKRLREAKNLRQVLSHDLGPFITSMPDPVRTPASQVSVPAAAQPIPVSELPKSFQLLRRSTPVPVRPGSVVPSTTEPARHHQPTKPGPEQDYGR